MAANIEPLLTPDDMAAVLRISRVHLDILVKQGKVTPPVVRIAARATLDSSHG